MFIAANLREATLRGTAAKNALFVGADLRGANAAGLYAVGADLTEVKAVRANLDKAQLQFANLSKADLRGASLRYAELEQTILHALDDQGAHWDGSTQTKVHGTDKDLQEAEAFRPPRSSDGLARRRKRSDDAP